MFLDITKPFLYILSYLAFIHIEMRGGQDQFIVYNKVALYSRKSRAK